MYGFINNWVYEAHKRITEATELSDLYLDIPSDESIPAHCFYNVNGCALRQLKYMDEGLFCHTVNKVAKWMREGKCPKCDVLGILTPAGYGEQTWGADKVVARYTQAME